MMILVRSGLTLKDFNMLFWCFHFEHSFAGFFWNLQIANKVAVIVSKHWFTKKQLFMFLFPGIMFYNVLYL